ncbi:uncharacterized protein L203_101709 [Cryptococcus depauperatus CBS 7841]|uniref:Uncharacterized protein n=1 Tax=Cryptococcus depauperatus CBS 7841 TaxID=1295531 RepID=A0AAJ8JQD0_9TREE
MSSDESRGMGEIPDGGVFPFDFEESCIKSSSRELEVGSGYNHPSFATGSDRTSLDEQCGKLFGAAYDASCGNYTWPSDAIMRPDQIAALRLLEKTLSRMDTSDRRSSYVKSRPGLHRSKKVSDLESLWKHTDEFARCRGWRGGCGRRFGQDGCVDKNVLGFGDESE